MYVVVTLLFPDGLHLISYTASANIRIRVRIYIHVVSPEVSPFAFARPHSSCGRVCMRKRRVYERVFALRLYACGMYVLRHEGRPT